MLNLEPFVGKPVSIAFHGNDQNGNGTLLKDRESGNYVLAYHFKKKEEDRELHFDPDYVVSIREHLNFND